eukprot:9607213-Lingulodinium_polyedra.AAC.1
MAMPTRRAPICDPAALSLPGVSLTVQQLLALAPVFPWRLHASDALVLHKLFIREVLQLAAPKAGPRPRQKWLTEHTMQQ